MTKEDLNSIVTIKDLDDLYRRIIQDVKKIIIGRIPQKEFYSPIEFSKATGMKYSTVLYKCMIGSLAARQDCPGSNWYIKASEIERYKKEASDFDAD